MKYRFAWEKMISSQDLKVSEMINFARHSKKNSDSGIGNNDKG